MKHLLSHSLASPARCRRWLALVLLGGLLPGLAQAQAPCAPAYTTGGSNIAGPLAIRTQQSFTAPCTGKLTTLVVNPGTVDDLRSSGYFVVPAIKDVTGTITLATLPRTDQYYNARLTFDFSSANVLLTAGTQYRFEFLESTQSFPLFLFYSYAGNPYAGGEQILDGVTSSGRDLRGWTVNVAPTVQTGTISGPLCAGAAVSVPFMAYGTIGSGNTYTAQLSDASGSFAAPVIIGTLSSTASSGTIGATVPAGTASGAGYRIRVVASTAGFTTVPNATNLRISNTVAPAGSTSQSFSTGATVANLVATGQNIQWYAASSGGSALPGTTVLTNGTTYYASQTVSGYESCDRLAVTATVSSPATAPTVTTDAASAITNTSATLGGNVTADGNATVTERGVVYSSTNANPTIGGPGVTKDDNGSGLGSYQETIAGLAAGTTYAVRAYATNSAGTSYGAVQSFTTTAPAPPASATQIISSNGGTLFVNTGGTLHINGGVGQTGAAMLRTPGTTRVVGSLQAAAGSTLDLSTGLLDVVGDISAAAATTTATTGTLRLAGPANQSVSLGGGTVGQLVVSKASAGGSRLDLPTDLTAATGVTLTAGLVRTAPAAALVLPAGATLSGEGPGQYVQGNLRVSRLVSGTGSVDFTNGLVLDPAGQNLSTVTATRTAGLQTAGVSYGQNMSGSNRGIDRVWRVAATQPPTAPVNVTLRWPTDDDNGFVLDTNAQLWRAAQSTGPWSAEGLAASASARSFTAATSQLGVLTVSNVSRPLPVELLAFTADATDGAALLRWVTASEKNSAYFAIEVSTTGQDFREIGRQAAQGTSSQRHAYQFTDANLARYAAPLVYYRLRQLDLDGTASLSPVRAVAAGPAKLVLFPNPTRGAATLTGAAPGQLVQVFDALGRTVATVTADATGTAALALPLGTATGLYVVRSGSTALRLVME